VIKFSATMYKWVDCTWVDGFFLMFELEEADD